MGKQLSCRTPEGPRAKPAVILYRDLQPPALPSYEFAKVNIEKYPQYVCAGDSQDGLGWNGP